MAPRSITVTALGGSVSRDPGARAPLSGRSQRINGSVSTTDGAGPIPSRRCPSSNPVIPDDRRAPSSRAPRPDRGGRSRHDRQLLWRAPRRRKFPAACAFVAVRGATAPRDTMTTDLDSLIANLSAPDRDRLKGAFAADPELATGLETMLADLPASTQETLVRSLAVRLEQAPLGGGALIPALADVIQAALERPERDDT